MEAQRPSFKNPLRLLLNTTIVIFIILLVAYVGIRVAISYDGDSERVELLNNITQDIRLLGIFVFDFVRPFLQLIVILIILEWLLAKFGLSLNNDTLKIDWNVQTVIAMVVMIAFSLAALSGVQGAAMLKDVALVVVGFYFGTQKKTNEAVNDDSKVIVTDEHKNDQSHQ
jgi:hypothetical protein